MAHPLPGVTNSTPAGAPAALPGAIAMVTASSVHLQRADRGGVAALQVVPGPAVSEGLLVERVVVADEASRDAPDASFGELVGPVVKNSDRRHLARVEAGISGAAHHEVALQRTVDDRPCRVDRRLERVVPAEALSRRGHDRDLHVRGGHHQAIGVEAEDHVVPIERGDFRCDKAAFQGGGGQDRGEIRLQAAHLAVACIDHRRLEERIA